MFEVGLTLKLRLDLGRTPPTSLNLTLWLEVTAGGTWSRRVVEIGED